MSSGDSKEVKEDQNRISWESNLGGGGRLGDMFS